MRQTEFERVYDFGNLYAGFLKARRGKRGKASVAKFEANLLEALLLLSEMLKNKTYRMSEYFVFRVYEPKERVVMTNAFKDKVVQHSLCDNVLEPAFSRTFIRDNYASQKGRGPMTDCIDWKRLCGPTISSGKHGQNNGAGRRGCRGPARAPPNMPTAGFSNATYQNISTPFSTGR